MSKYLKKIKSYSKGNIEIAIYEDPEYNYTVSRCVDSKESSVQNDLDWEQADDLFEYFIDMFEEN